MDADRDPQRTAEVLATVQAIADRRCAQCQALLCGHDAVLSVVLGYKDRPSCHRCIAADLAEPDADLCERALQWIVRRDCFRRAWLWSSRREGQPEELHPRCLWPTPPAASARPAPVPVALVNAHDATFDAGDLGCGELVLELRQRLADMPAGAILKLRANDPGAPQDIPAWCGLTGHTLLSAQHPDYWIRRRPK